MRSVVNSRGRILLFTQGGRAALCCGPRCRQPGSNPGGPGDTRDCRNTISSLSGLFHGAWRDNELLPWSISKTRYKVTELWGWLGRTQVCKVPCVWEGTNLKHSASESQAARSGINSSLSFTCFGLERSSWMFSGCGREGICCQDKLGCGAGSKHKQISVDNTSVSFLFDF